MSQSPQKQDHVIFLCAVPLFLAWSAYIMMCPFFQMYAARTCGASEVAVGLVFAALPLASCLASFPVGKMIAKFGCSTCLTTGLLTLAFSAAAFGASRTIASWLCWRVVQGVATTAVLNTISTILATTFPDREDFAYANGIINVVTGAACTCGPLAAGFLFQVGGFLLPFVVSSVLLVLTASVERWWVPICTHGRVEAPEQKQPLLDGSEHSAPSQGCASVQPLGASEVCTCLTLCMAGVAAMTMGCWGALEVMFAAHFRDVLGVSSGSVVGALVALPCVPSALGSVLAPRVSRRIGGICTVLMGLALFALGCLGFGIPTPEQAPAWLQSRGFERGSPLAWMLQVLSLLFLGLGFSVSWTMLLPSMLNTALTTFTSCKAQESSQLRKELVLMAVSPAVVAVFNSAGSMGKALGPALGGGLIEVIGFSKASVTFGATALAWGCILAYVARQELYQLASPKSDLREPCAEQA